METEIYKGYEIEIDNTDYAENPFEQWDGNVPLIAPRHDPKNKPRPVESPPVMMFNPIASFQSVV